MIVIIGQKHDEKCRQKNRALKSIEENTDILETAIFVAVYRRTCPLAAVYSISRRRSNAQEISRCLGAGGRTVGAWKLCSAGLGKLLDRSKLRRGAPSREELMTGSIAAIPSTCCVYRETWLFAGARNRRYLQLWSGAA